jgi:hypothetical protein
MENILHNFFKILFGGIFISAGIGRRGVGNVHEVDQQFKPILSLDSARTGEIAYLRFENSKS